MSSDRSKIARAALVYAELGWRVHPLRHRGKVPVLLNWVYEASCDQETVAAWWEERPKANVGIATGKGSGVVVIDVDPDNGGDDSMMTVVEKHGPLPETVEVITGSGGRHLYFRAPDVEIKTNVNIFASIVAPDEPHKDAKTGVDARGEGGQVVAPPSIHPETGREWEWVNGRSPWDIEPAEMPEWMVDLLKKEVYEEPPPQKANALAFSNFEQTRIRSYVERVLDEEVAAVASAAEGGRNHRLNQAAFSIATLAHSGEINEEHAVSALLEGALRSGLGERESKRTIRSGWRSGLRKPRDLQEIIRKEDPRYTNVVDLSDFHAPRAHEFGQPPMRVIENNDDDDEYEKRGMPLGEPFPEECLEVPGMLGELTAWIDSCAFREAPILSLAGAITFCGALFGRKYCGETNLRTNIYAMGIATTGAGKENAQRCINELVNAAGSHVMGAEEIGSDAGLLMALEKEPRQLFMLDEFGKQLATWTSKYAGNWESKILPLLTKIYERSSHSYRGKALGGRDTVVINEPHVCIYGTATPGQFWRALDSSSAEDGFLSRVLLFMMPPGRGGKQKVRRAAQSPPSPLVEWVRAIEQFQPDDPTAGDLAGLRSSRTTSTLKEVPMTGAAERVLDDLDDEIDQHVKGAYGELWVRSWAHASKLALVRAISREYFAPKVSEEDALWGAQLARWSTRRLVQAVAERVSDSRFEADVKKLLRVIRNGGDRGVSQRDITRRSQWLNRRGRQDVLDHLIEAGLVAHERVLSGNKGGRPTVRYRSLVDDATLDLM